MCFDWSCYQFLLYSSVVKSHALRKGKHSNKSSIFDLNALCETLYIVLRMNITAVNYCDLLNLSFSLLNAWF